MGGGHISAIQQYHGLDYKTVKRYLDFP